MSEAFSKPTKTTIFISLLLVATCAIAQDGTIYPLAAPAGPNAYSAKDGRC